MKTQATAETRNGLQSIGYELLDSLKWKTFVSSLIARFYATHGFHYVQEKFFGVRAVLRLEPFALMRDAPLEIHILTCSKDTLLSLWALASWYEIGGRHDRLCIHEDGSLAPEDKKIFFRMFPGCRVITKSEADEAAAEQLRRYPHVRAYREMYKAAMKLLDFAFFSRDEDFLLMDSDVLTLRSVEGIDTYFSSPNNIFMRDFQYALKLDRARFEEFSCAPVYLPVNTGFGRVRRGTLDLDRVEFILRTAPEILGSAWAEQTLYALLSAKFGVTLLGPEFNVSKGFGVQGIKLKHYAGLAKRLLYVEGLPAVRGALMSRHHKSES